MNYFFKYLVPQLLEYFNNDKEILKLFIPKAIDEKFQEETKKLNDVK